MIVELKNGPAIPEEVIALGCDLERQGLKLTVAGDSLRVTNQAGGKPVIAPEDAERIRAWKPHLMAVVEYVEKGSIDAP